MSISKLTEFIPQNWIESLARLGRTDWVKLKSVEASSAVQSTCSLQHCFEQVDDLSLLSHIQSVCQGGGFELQQIVAYSKLIAGGAKIVQPSTEKCFALDRVDANVTLNEYEQPFPELIVEFPKDFRKAMQDGHGVRCPKFILLMHDRDVPLLFSSTEDRSEINPVFTFMAHDQRHQTIENFLQQHILSDGDADCILAISLQRIAFNLALLLTHQGAVDSGPLDPKRVTKWKQLLKSKSKKKRDRARRFLNASMNLIAFDQEVSLVEGSQYSGSTANRDGSPKSPHWRRGHFRRQRVGAGRKEVRLVFVKPILINPNRFSGERSNTEYRIRVGDGRGQSKYRPSERKRLPETRLDRHDDQHRSEGR